MELHLRIIRNRHGRARMRYRVSRSDPGACVCVWCRVGDEVWMASQGVSCVDGSRLNHADMSVGTCERDAFHRPFCFMGGFNGVCPHVSGLEGNILGVSVLYGDL